MMKKILLAYLLAGYAVFSASAAENHAAKLPVLAGEKVQTTWSDPAVATVKNGVYTLYAVLPENMIHYAGFKFKMQGDLAKQALQFTISSTAPGKTRALYVRCYDKQNKCIASWSTWNSPVTSAPQTLTVAPGIGYKSLEWEPGVVNADGTAFETIEFIFGHKGKAGAVYDAKIEKIGFCAIPKEDKSFSRPKIAANISREKIELLGIAAKSSELRGSIAFMENGRRYLLTRPQDHGQTGYILLTDLESGKTEQFFNPPEVRQGDSFGAILTGKGHYLYDQQGGNVVLFDLKTRKFRNLGRPESRAMHFMVYTEAPDGTVYLGGYPQATLTAWNPETGKFRNYGRMDPKESYLNKIATDKNGYVYCGIGSARANLVALDPKTGKVTQIIPENMRSIGWGEAITGSDGYAYLIFGKFRAKMLDGKIVATDVALPAPKKILATKYGDKMWQFENGTLVTGVDLYKKVITYQGLDGKKKEIPFDYQSGGLSYTSIGADGKGRIYGSTNHPMHFVEYNANAGKMTDHGPHTVVSGGNFCNMTYAKDGTVYLCEYAGGRLWKFNPEKPFDGGNNVAPPLPASIGAPEMQQIGKAEKGHFTLIGNSILLCFGDQDGATFTFPVNIKKSGKYFVNMLAFEHAVYGTATFDFQGQKQTVNLQKTLDRSRLITLGPVDLAPGSYPLTVTVKSHGGSSKPMAGILAMSVTDKPAKLAEHTEETNPKVLGAWNQQVTRPRAVQIHPDGKHVVIAGYAGYGLCGGSFGIHNLATGKNSVLSDWLEGHSCITFRFTEKGDIVGGSDISAPGGGYVKAVHPAIFRIDWKTKKVVASKELPGIAYVAAVELWNGKLYAALNNGQVVVADPETMNIERTFASNGKGSPVRNALMKTPDNRLFLLQYGGISEFHPQSGDLYLRCVPQAAISTGGAVYNGYLYFACKVQYARWKIPAPLK